MDIAPCIFQRILVEVHYYWRVVGAQFNRHGSRMVARHVTSNFLSKVLRQGLVVLPSMEKDATGVRLPLTSAASVKVWIKGAQILGEQIVWKRPKSVSD